MIRLSKDLKTQREELNNQPGRPTGFDLRFTPGKNYDLDVLLTDYNRKNPGALKIEVRDEKALLNKLNIEVNKDVDKLKTNIGNIISRVFTKYGLQAGDVVNEKISNEIEREVNDLTKVLGYNFTFTFDGMHVDVSYDGVAISEKFKDLYRQYCEEFSKGVTQDGGLAINNKKIKLSPTVADYNKHLLSDQNKSKNVQTPPGIHRPLVIWTEGTEDQTKPEDVNKLTEYEQEINYLKQNMVLKSEVSNNILHNIDALLSKPDMIPNINAVFELFKEILVNEEWKDTETVLVVPKLSTQITDTALVIPSSTKIEDHALIL